MKFSMVVLLTTTLLLSMVIVSTACGNGSPMAPSPAQADLTGEWIGTLASLVGGPGALGDWSHLALNLQTTGNGDLTTNDGQHFSVVGHFGSNGVRVLDLEIAPSSLCPSVELVITTVQVDGEGHVNGFSGSLAGRCSNTLAAAFTFSRVSR